MLGQRLMGVSDPAKAEYFAERAIVEQALSDEAGESNAAAAHAELSERYGVLAEVFKTDQPTSKIAYKLATTAPIDANEATLRSDCLSPG